MARGRPKGSGKMVQLSAMHREKIAASTVLDRVLRCAEGELEMTRIQLDAALALLRKYMPDEANVKMDHNVAGQVTFHINTGVPSNPSFDNMPLIENKPAIQFDADDAEFEEIESQIDDWNKDN